MTRDFKNDSVRQVSRPIIPLHQSLTHLLSLIGEPTSDERKALRAIVSEADVIEVDGMHYILSPVSPDIIDILSSFEAEHAELDTIDEDMCSARDDDPTYNSHFGGGPGACEDDEPDYSI